MSTIKSIFSPLIDDKPRRYRLLLLISLIITVQFILIFPYVAKSFGMSATPFDVYSPYDPYSPYEPYAPNSGPGDYYFPWYDTQFGRTWVLTAMPKDGGNNSFDVFFNNQLMSGGTFSVTQGNTRPNYFPNQLSGPVKVTAHDSAGLVSERSLFGNSFEEIWATRYEELDSTYYWPVYDGVASGGMRNWILVANPAENDRMVRVEIRVHVPGYGNDVIDITNLQPGEMINREFPGLRSGPVTVSGWDPDPSPGNLGGMKIIASQRVLYQGAFNEMPGIPQSKSSPYWAWTWYDNKSPGANAWICVGTPQYPDLGPIYVLMVTGESGAQFIGPVPRGETVILRESEPVMDGPVLLVGCFDGSSVDNCLNTPADVFASQRSIWGASFSEISGINDADIGPNAHWTWYDGQSPGSKNWVLISNMNDTQIFAEVKVAGIPKWNGWIAPLANQTPIFPGIMGGPVEVRAWSTDTRTPGTEADIFASQRVIWNGYFNEIVGKGM